ncbi:hypothetical protein R2F61_03620 [Mollicutes bacterium LVI A0078]|nr:hypothetical protein RZE84_03650 [Mollicutes bacterium LVI A0075]WOO91652.1 hypothetical protein R2F61_03620 [Mollicutes bacterium LVI A0078]
MPITNTGDFAVRIRSLFIYFDLVADSDEYYVYGSYGTTNNMKFSLDGVNYMTWDELAASFTTSYKIFYNYNKM